MQPQNIALKTSWLGYKNNLVRRLNQFKHFDKNNLVKREGRIKTTRNKVTYNVVIIPT
jgi:hypothetical protein